MNLFFDLDGTISDSRPGIVASMRHALERMGRTPPPEAELLRYIGPPTHEAFPEILGSGDPALVEQAIAYYRERYGSEGLYEATLYPGVREGLAVLAGARDRRVWVVTSKPLVYAERIIQHFGLRSFFVRVYGSELNGVRGNKGDLIAYVLESERLQPEETWMFGDRLHDILGARNNGVHPAGVLWGYGARKELADAGAERLFASMSELVSALTGS